MSQQLPELLVAARTRLAMPQTRLASLANISLASVKAYERGKRHPSRPHLMAVMDALNVERGERNAIFLAAGYALDGERLGPTALEMGFTRAGAQEECDRARWPCFVLSEFSELMCANDIAQTLWGIDLATEFTGPGERAMLAVASQPRFADCLLNWDAAMSAMVAAFKGHHRGPENVEEPSAMFKTMLDRFLAGDPKYVARFLELWQRVTPRQPELRWHYPITWRHPSAGVMRFDAVVSTCNITDASSFNDWVPVDAESWANLELVRGL
jgi:transcriptional regulator with XRE-family HTH domain